MPNKTIRLCTYVPPEMLKLIDRRIKDLAYSGYADYIRSLIRNDLVSGGYYRPDPNTLKKVNEILKGSEE